MPASVPTRAVLALVVLLAAAGCRSSDRPEEAARNPDTPVTQRDGTTAGGDPDGGTAPGGSGAGGAPGDAGGSGAGGAGGTGVQGGGGGTGSGGGGGPFEPPEGRGPIVPSPNDPGAGPPRPKGWRTLPPGPLRSRHGASAVWTGREMIVWGGAWRAGNASIWLDDGAAYDPAADRWRTIAPSPLAGRADAFIAWTGKYVLIWGGQRQGSLAGFGDEWADGALYDPAKDTWKYMAEWPLAERYGARAVWTGKRLVVWGGASSAAGDVPPPLADGAAYDPERNKWTKLAEAPLAGRIAPLAGARGDSVLFSWGPSTVRDGTREPAADSALYDTDSNRWSPAAPAPDPNPAKNTWCRDAPGCVGVDAGNRIVFAGQGLAWDAGANRWSTIAPNLFADPLLEGKARAWTGSKVLFWGGGTLDDPGDRPPASVVHAGAAYDVATDRWEGIPGGPLSPRARAAAVWTGRELIVWGGEGDQNHRGDFADGAAYTM